MLTATLALALLSTPTPQTVGQLEPDDTAVEAVMAPVNGLFAALARRDGRAVSEHIDPVGRITVVVEDPDGSSRLTRRDWAQFANGLQPGPEAFEEVLVQPLVAVDGDIAVVWGRYLFRIDGRTSHCGVDHFDLVRQEDGRWRIVNLSWTQRKTGCEAIEALIPAT